MSLLRASRVFTLLPGILACFLFSCDVPKEDEPPDPPQPTIKPGVDRPGSPKAWEGTLANGNMQLSALLSVDGVGLTYNSLDTGYQGGYGSGWRLNVRSTLDRDEQGSVTIRRPDGTPVFFLYNGTGYQAEPQVTSRLSFDVHDFFTETFLGGTRLIYQPLNGIYVLHRIVDRNNNAITIDRDAQGHETTLVDTWGQVTRFTWNGDKLSAVQDQEGRTFSLEYNQSGDLVSITQPTIDAGVPVERFAYAGTSHLLVSHVTPAGMTTTYGYYDDGSLKTAKGPAGYTMLVEYTLDSVTQKFSLGEEFVQHFENGQLVSVTNDLGLSVHYTRDDRHRIIGVTNAFGHTWEYQYNDADDMTYEKNPLGQETVMAFDDNHNALSITQYGLNWKYQYNQYNQIIKITDPAGGITTYERDSRGNLLKIMDADGTVLASAEYNLNGTLASISNAYGDTTTYEYDSNNNVVSVEHPDRGSMTMTRSPMGLLLEAATGAGDQTSFSYDSRGSATGFVFQGTGTKGDPRERTLTLGRDLDARVNSYEYNGPNGSKTGSQQLGSNGNVTKDESNGTTTQDGECPCIDPPAP